MRILFLTQWFQPEPAFKSLPFAEALARQGHQIEVLTGFPNYPGGKLYPGYRLRLWHREQMDEIRVNRVALYPSHDKSGLRRIINYTSFALSTFVLALALVDSPDIIYTYNLVTLGPTACLLRWRYGAKLILDVQDLWPESVTQSGMLHNPIAVRLLTCACNWLYRQFDWLTVLSPGFKQTLVKRGVPADQIEVIYNWADETNQQLQVRDDELACSLGLQGKFTILFAGTMGVMQGLGTVLDAAEICRQTHPHIQFVLIGGGVERAALQAQLIERRIENVQLLSPQPTEAMGRYYALADALLVHLKDDPLFQITIPSKTQVYLSMGKPILMAMCGDAADLIRRAGAGLVCPPDDPSALAECVKRLAMMSDVERDRMGQAGLKFYRQNLSMAAGVARFEQRMKALTQSR